MIGEEFIKRIESLEEKVEFISRSQSNPDRLYNMVFGKFVFIYHMGKVASTAIARSLDRRNYDYIFCQWMSDDSRKFCEYFAMEYDNRAAYKNVMHAGRCRFLVKQPDFIRGVRILTVVRDPVANFLSHFFHSWGLFEKVIADRYGEVSLETVNQYIEESCNLYLEYDDTSLMNWAKDQRIHPVIFNGIRNSLYWFDSEMKEFTDIDVYQYKTPDPFVYCRNLMVLKYERLNECLPELSNFLDIPNFEIIFDNVGEEKYGGELYRKVKAEIKLPSIFLDRIYSSRYAKHFYSVSEIENFRSRWE